MILLIIIVIILIVAFIVIRTKISNKMHRTFMKSSGLGDALNENTSKINAKAISKLDKMLEDGKITQEQYERRKKNLSEPIDFNKKI